MKKSKSITLCILLASVIACNSEKKEKERLFFRADTNIISYQSYNSHSFVYVHFYPYGVYHNGIYVRSGYYNSRAYKASVSHNSPVVRGGMGRTGRGGFSVST